MCLNSSRGITIFELLIVIAVIGILAAAGIPALLQQINESRIKLAGEELYQSLQFARSEALKQHTDVYFTLNTGTVWCYGAKLGSTCNCTQANSCTFKEISSSNYNSNLSLTSNGISGNTIVFDGVRGTTGQTGTISFSLGNLLIKLGLNQMGTLTICSTDVWGYPVC